MMEIVVSVLIGIVVFIGVIVVLVYIHSKSEGQGYKEPPCSEVSHDVSCPEGCVYAKCSSGVFDEGTYTCWNANDINNGKLNSCY